MINALHIVGIGLLIGSIITLDIRVVGIWKPVDWRDAVSIASPVAVAGLTLALLTGVLLLAVRGSHYIVNAAFLIKSGIVGLAIVNVVAFHALLRRCLDEQPSVAICALVSIASWVAAIFAGRWIAFTL